METDVVVIGSGGAGLIAALHAATRGARVTVLEKAPVFGGHTAMSGGAQWVPGNPVGRQQLGLQDSSSEAERYLDALSLGLVPKTVRAFVREAPQYYDFLAANASCEIEPAYIPDYYQGQPGAKDSGRCITIGAFDTNRLGEYKDLLRVPPYPGSVYLRHTEEQAGTVGGIDPKELATSINARREKGIALRGRALIGALMEACLKHGVQLIHSVPVTQLLQNDRDGRVVGVLALREGKPEKYEARKGVVLASGGFEWDRALWDDLLGVPFDGPLGPPYTAKATACAWPCERARGSRTWIKCGGLLEVCRSQGRCTKAARARAEYQRVVDPGPSR